MASLLFRGVGQECAHARQFASGRRRAQPLPSPVGKERAKVGCAEAEQSARGDFLAAIASEEVDQPVSRRNIGAHRVRGTAAVML